jgi:hypothetical protein
MSVITIYLLKKIVYQKKKNLIEPDHIRVK